MTDLTREELLVLFIEDCGKAIQAATLCLRTGIDRDHSIYGLNSTVLAMAGGDITGCIDALKLPATVIERERGTRIERASAAKRAATIVATGK